MGSKQEEEEKIKVWKEVFDLFDANKDGYISTDELGVVLRGLDLNPTEKEIKEIATQLDKNKNGKIEFSEFVALMKNKQRSREEEKDDMIRAFRIVDRDDNKYIDKFELKRLMTKFGEVLSEEEVDLMIKVADLNRDGKIDYNEFVKFLLQPCL
ncbi:hypothetical protein LOTGIDRAFT_227222 [Lottia gigantea]|uniref:EF-hand domain-containing protein n=1 Tax=Lottia gigantea TaxID=225164 RepID=V3ZVU1_LOTGI|nr:hypothetical protein LOTGIDRAFT_227222 [Lottia gigantea]ESO95633.1 hypothetical protein LOTGIDRAFT_227222 [Lottia gigantea]